MATLSVVTLLVGIFLLLLGGDVLVSGLRCKKCANIKGGIAGIGGQSDPNCEDGSVSTETCSNNNDKCYYAEFEGTQLFVTLGGHMRGCTSVPLFSQNGCFDLDEDAKGLIDLIHFISSTEVTGKICYCDTDNCDARCEGLFMLASFCVTLWMVAVAGGVVVVLILCCICCCCCCNKGSSGQVHATPQVQIHTIPLQQTAVVTQSPGQAYAVQVPQGGVVTQPQQPNSAVAVQPPPYVKT